MAEGRWASVTPPAALTSMPDPKPTLDQVGLAVPDCIV